jgi:hypothetical protein
MWLLRRRLIILLRSDDPLYRILQDEVGDLIAAYERASQGPAVNGDDENFL